MFARIASGRVAEITASGPEGLHPALAATYVSVAGVTPAPAVGWTYAAGLFYAPVMPPVAPPTTMSPLTFFGRFTDAETVSLHTAALSNATVFGFLLSAAAAQVIDLADPRLKAGLDALVTAGLLAPARETAILAP